MLATLKVIREQFGGPEGYIVEKCGLTKQEVDKIRLNLVVEAPPLDEKHQHSL